MRTNLLKSFSAVGVFALGLAGAFVTEAKTGSDVAGAPINAYQKNNPIGTDCSHIKTCQFENSGELCRVVDGDDSSLQLWAMQGGTCTRTLYRYVPN